MKDLLPEVLQWAERGRPFVVATVVAVRRSAPRTPGAKMAIDAEGRVLGAVSGGCVEGAVVAVAQEALQGDLRRVLSVGFSDAQGWGVGLPCGGELDVMVERFGGAAMERFVDLARSDGRGALVTELGEPFEGRRALVTEHELLGIDYPPRCSMQLAGPFEGARGGGRGR